MTLFFNTILSGELISWCSEFCITMVINEYKVFLKDEAYFALHCTFVFSNYILNYKESCEKKYNLKRNAL